MIRKSMLNKSGIEYIDYNCNHYEGCSHGCLYPCYARLYRYKSYEEWVKPEPVENAIELLRKEVECKSKGRVMVCSTSDPYQPINRKYMLTGQVLKILLDSGFKVLVQTKSSDVLMDMDLFNENAIVGMTIISLDEQMRARWEPYASPIASRIAALKTLHKHGFRTRICMEPIIPNTPPEDILAVFDLLHQYVDEWWIGRLNHQKVDLDYYRRLKPMIDKKVEQLGISASVNFKKEISAFPHT